VPCRAEFQPWRCRGVANDFAKPQNAKYEGLAVFLRCFKHFCKSPVITERKDIMKKVLVFILLSSVSIFAEYTYTITDLGWTGVAENSKQPTFSYDIAAMEELPTLGGGHTYVQCINDNNQAAGRSDLAGVEGTYHAFLYDGVTIHDLGTLGGKYSDAYGINNNKQIVGYSDLAGNSVSHAFLYDGTAMHDLGTLGGKYSGAYGINNINQIVGSSYITGSSTQHAFLYDGTTMRDLGTLGGTHSRATCINDNNQIAGSSYISGNSAFHAFLYDGTTMHDLGSLGGEYSFAYGINNYGYIVGANGFYENFEGTRAFLYDGDSMIDLNDLLPDDSGWVLSSARDINNLGQIIGYGSFNGETRAFLMTPTIPEPATLLLLGIGCIICRRK
jgi:probable HAF family extracellular repeat protein